MAAVRRAARASAGHTKQLSQPKSTPVRRSARQSIKREDSPAVKHEDVSIKEEEETPKKPKLVQGKAQKRSASNASPSPTPKKRRVEPNGTASPSPKKSSLSKKAPTAESATELRNTKLKKYAQFANVSPYPKFDRPTAEECHKARSILESIHGERKRPKEVKASAVTAGCGDSPSVLDALVRTILSQNTSNKNSTAAKLSMDDVYGHSDNWEAIAKGGESQLVDAIRCGGLAQIKSRVILKILTQVHEKYGTYSLDHLHNETTEEAFTELLSFQGVGPKTASCVVLFCLERESFAVDTHVFRISKLLGWVPKEADREKAQAHLETKVPPEDKYALHILMVTHGKVCGECKAKKEQGAKCKLRDAFRGKGGVDPKIEEKLKEEGLQDEEGE